MTKVRQKSSNLFPKAKKANGQVNSPAIKRMSLSRAFAQKLHKRTWALPPSVPFFHRPPPGPHTASHGGQHMGGGAERHTDVVIPQSRHGRRRRWCKYKAKNTLLEKKNGQSALFHRMITSTRGGGGGGGKERPTPPLLSPSRPPSSSSSRPPCSWRAPPPPPPPRTPPRLLGETRVSKLEWFFFLDNLRETLFSLLS